MEDNQIINFNENGKVYSTYLEPNLYIAKQNEILQYTLPDFELTVVYYSPDELYYCCGIIDNIAYYLTKNGKLFGKQIYYEPETDDFVSYDISELNLLKYLDSNLYINEIDNVLYISKFDQNNYTLYSVVDCMVLGTKINKEFNINLNIYTFEYVSRGYLWNTKTKYIVNNNGVYLCE